MKTLKKTLSCLLISLICLCSNSLFYLTINGESNKLNETGNSITRGEWMKHFAIVLI